MYSKDVQALFRRGVALEETSIRQAVAVYQQLVELEPLHAEGWVNLGVCHFRERNLSLAEGCYRQAISILPNYALAHFDLGNVLDDQGKVVEAQAEYMRAIALGRDYADAHYNAALGWEKMNEPRKAIRHWQAYVKLDPASKFGQHARERLRWLLSHDPLQLVARTA